MAMVMPSAASVPYVDLRISDGSHLMSDAKDLVQRLRKEWSLDEIRSKEFSEGYNNKLVAFMHDDDVNDMSDVIVVRVYGPQTDMIVNREQEIKCMVLFHRAGCAAQLYCRFNNGFAYQYSPGRVLDLDHAYDPHVMRLLTKELARVHCVKPETIRTDDAVVKREGIHLDAKPRLFAALDNFLQILPESFDEMEKQAKLEKMAASREELKKEVDYLRSFLCPLGSPVVLCHNDLLFNNILYNDETQKVSFIDFEFAAFNYQAFDIATHFCEYAGMKVVDYSNLPDRSYQLRWLRSYLESYFEFQGRAAGKVSDDEVEKLYDQVDKFTLGAHMFWGMWALVQSKYSDIDYDYLDYARIRISEYYRRKQDFLAQDADH